MMYQMPSPPQVSSLSDAEPDVAEVEAVDAEVAEEDRQQQRDQPLLVGEDAGHSLAWNQPPPLARRTMVSGFSCAGRRPSAAGGPSG